MNCVPRAFFHFCIICNVNILWLKFFVIFYSFHLLLFGVCYSCYFMCFLSFFFDSRSWTTISQYDPLTDSAYVYWFRCKMKGTNTIPSHGLKIHSTVQLKHKNRFTEPVFPYRICSGFCFAPFLCRFATEIYLFPAMSISWWLEWDWDSKFNSTPLYISRGVQLDVCEFFFLLIHSLHSFHTTNEMRLMLVK